MDDMWLLKVPSKRSVHAISLKGNMGPKLSEFSDLSVPNTGVIAIAVRIANRK